jgi:hypothetical protein
MLVFSILFLTNLVIFVRNSWIRRQRLNKRWAVELNNGISRSEFARLLVTVLSMLLIYWPFSIYCFVEFFQQGRLLPYHWKIVHGPFWKLIVFIRYDKVTWSGWIGVYLAVTSFAFIGFTRNARRTYQHCIEVIYDHIIPKKLQAKLPRMQKISETCKERRNAQFGLSNHARSDIVVMDRYLPWQFFLIIPGHPVEAETPIGLISMLVMTSLYTRVRRQS